jgi:hypothetical protein
MCPRSFETATTSGPTRVLLRIGEVGTPPPIRMKKKSKERARDEKTSSLPFKTPPLPQQNLLAAVFLVPNRKERELLSTQKRARNDYDERIPTLSKEWERTSNRDLMRRKRRRERRRRTPSAKTARSRRERETHVVRFDPREHRTVAPSAVDALSLTAGPDSPTRNCRLRARSPQAFRPATPPRRTIAHPARWRAIPCLWIARGGGACLLVVKRTPDGRNLPRTSEHQC